MKGLTPFTCHICTYSYDALKVSQQLCDIWFLLLYVCPISIWTENLTISNHGISLSDSFISTFSKYFLSPKTVCMVILQQIYFLLSVGHHALKSWADVAITITRGSHHSYLNRPLSSCCKPGFTFILIV